MEKTRRRIVTKIGDVFCIEIDGQYKCYFQYIANDMECLNSSVIRIFKKKYPMDFEPDIDAIVNGEIGFYAHTILKAGISDNIWYKVGKSKQIGNLEGIFFGLTNDEFLKPMPKVSNNWYVWKLGGKMVKVGKLEGIYKGVEIGMVFNYRRIIYRITKGKYPYPYPE